MHPATLFHCRRLRPLQPYLFHRLCLHRLFPSPPPPYPVLSPVLLLLSASCWAHKLPSTIHGGQWSFLCFNGQKQFRDMYGGRSNFGEFWGFQSPFHVSSVDRMRRKTLLLLLELCLFHFLALSLSLFLFLLQYYTVLCVTFCLVFQRFP